MPTGRHIFELKAAIFARRCSYVSGQHVVGNEPERRPHWKSLGLLPTGDDNGQVPDSPPPGGVPPLNV